jgi:hypothetical protein
VAVEESTTGSVEVDSSLDRTSNDVVFVYVAITTRELTTSTVDNEVVVGLCVSGTNAYVTVTEVTL